MLLRFAVANYLSIQERQELSLVSTSLKDREEGLIECSQAPAGRLLPAAIIYGANASGKSNFVLAIRWFRTAIMRSHSHYRPGGNIPRQPFALDPASASRPSVFDVDFVVEDVRYHYGFEATDKAFTAEWLYAFPRGRRQIMFERRGEREIDFGRELKGRKEVIADLMRPNSLFLSTAAQNGHEELSRISSFFESISIETSISVGGAKISSAMGEGGVDERVIAFLGKLATGITGYRRGKLDKTNIDKLEIERVILKALNERFGARIELDLQERQSPIIELAHRGIGADQVYFDIDRESAGTRKMLLLLGLVYRALDTGSCVVADELEVSLHTQACEAIVSLFLNKSTNPKGAQLIATTHDTNLMLSALLRRDQIWFTEKDDGGATHLFPLSDIRTRQNDNIEKGYLQGRYGAIPFAGSADDLLARG